MVSTESRRIVQILKDRQKQGVYTILRITRLQKDVSNYSFVVSLKVKL
jgi:hypothetical protein